MTTSKDKLNQQQIFQDTLYDLLPCGVMQLDACSDDIESFKLISFNARLWQMFGYRSREQYLDSIRGENKFKDIHPDDLKLISDSFDLLRTSDKEQISDIDHRIICTDGSMRWVRLSIKKVSYTKNEKILILLLTDITETRQESLNQLSNALFSVYDTVYEFDTSENTTSLCASRIGHESSIGQLLPLDLQIKRLCDRIPDIDERKKVSEFFLCIENNGDIPKTIEYNYIASDNKKYSISSMVIHVSRSVYMACNRDITTEKAAQALSTENEVLREKINRQKQDDARNRLFVEAADVMILDYNTKTDSLHFHRKASDGNVITEIRENYLSSMLNSSSVRVSDRFMVQNNISQMSLSPTHKIVEYSANFDGNGYKDYQIILVSIPDENGQVYRILGQSVELENKTHKFITEKLERITGISYNGIPYNIAIAEEVLQLLESSVDTDTAVNSAFALIGSKLDVSRVYLIEEHGDGMYCSNTFEWCNKGISSELNKLQNFRYPDEICGHFSSIFDDEGILACSDVLTLSPWLRDILISQEIKSILLCAIMEDGKLLGYVGFDDCTQNRNWTQGQIDTLRILSNAVAMFLFKNRNKETLTFAKTMLKEFDKSPAYIYIIDADTYAVLYRNTAANSIFGTNVDSPCQCYKAIMNRDTPCSVCPVATLRKIGLSVPTVINRGGKICISYADSYLWHGRRVFLVSCIDSSTFVENPEMLRQLKYEHDVSKYSKTLFGLYDELFELDFAKNTFVSVRSKIKTPSTPAGKVFNLDKASAKWLKLIECESDRNLFSKMTDPTYIRHIFRQGTVPVFEFPIRLNNKKQKWYAFTLLRIDADRYLCCCKNITDQKNAENLRSELSVLKTQADLQESYRMIIDQAKIAVYEMNHVTGCSSFSEAFCNYAVCRYDDDTKTLKKVNYSLVHPKDHSIMKKLEQEFNNGNAAAEATLRIQMLDGSFHWTRLSCSRLYKGDDMLSKTIITLTDIDTDLRERLELERISDKFRNLVQNISIGICIGEYREKVYPVYANDKVIDMLGFTKEEYELRIVNNVPVSFQANFSPAEYMQNKEDGETFVVEELHMQRNDNGKTIRLRAVGTVDKKHKYPLCHVVLTELTE